MLNTSKIATGQVVYSVTGAVYRVTSKLKTGDGVVFKFANLNGNPVSVPDNFRPVTAAYAKFAAWQRFVVAFNRDFDLYVKEYIRAAGLPIDNDMDWSKFFEKLIVPRLVEANKITDWSEREAIKDEAIHHIIITSLAQRSVLAKKIPGGFFASEFYHEAEDAPVLTYLTYLDYTNNPPPAVEGEPPSPAPPAASEEAVISLAKRVSKFLMNLFRNYRVSEANRYIRESIFQQDADSMWGESTSEEGDEGADTNLLDTEDRATLDQGYGKVEIMADVETFAKGFYRWLMKREKPNMAKIYVKLYDLWWLHALNEPRRGKHGESGLVKQNDLKEEWVALFNPKTPEDTNKASRSLNTMWPKLPAKMKEYMSEDALPFETNLWDMQIADMNRTKDNKKDDATVPAAIGATASAKKADESEPIATQFFTEDVPKAVNNATGGGSMPPMGGGAEEGAGALGEVAEALPLALAAVEDEHHHEETTPDLTHEDEGYYIRMVYLQNGDLELQATEQLKQEIAGNDSWNPTIYELLEDFTSNGWEWVRPEDIGALTDGEIIADPDGHIFWHERYQIEDPIEELKTAGKFRMQGGGKLNGEDEEEEGTLPVTAGLGDGLPAQPMQRHRCSGTYDVDASMDVPYGEGSARYNQIDIEDCDRPGTIECDGCKEWFCNECFDSESHNPEACELQAKENALDEMDEDPLGEF